MWAVIKLAVEREEAYLAQKFGALYLDYKSRVRRWI
jgi:protein-S-isoprenylcysteine O-methyltransferase Ste14